MSVTTEAFIANFHALPGITIAEKKRNLKRLLQRANPDINFNLLHPKTVLEEKFKLESLIHFRKTSDLIETLKGENLESINRILKLEWFLQEIVRNFNADALVNEVLPRVSFNTKVKLLNKLSSCVKDAKLGDEVFHNLQNKYGLYLATRMLTACSQGVILNCVKNSKIKPAPAQLLTIVRKYPEITEELLGLFKSNKVEVESLYKNVFLYLIRNDVELFIKLRKKHDIHLWLGKRKTRKTISSNKERVIENSGEYLGILQSKAICKGFGPDFSRFYYSIFPSSLSQFEKSFDQVFLLIKNAPKSSTCDINLLLVTYQRAYGSSILDNSKCMSNLELLQLLPRDERLKVVKPESKPSHVSEDEWNCYYDTSKSIPYLKKRISFTSDIETRAKLISMLIKTCKINRDSEELTKVCEYFLKRHRNDHISVRLGFLRSLRKDYSLRELKEEQWKYVNELLELFTLNGEECYQGEEITLEYIRFRLMMNLPIVEEMKLYLKNIYSYVVWNFLKENPDLEKRCLLVIGKVYPEVFKPKDMQHYHVKFLTSLLDFNKRHPSDTIPVLQYPEAINATKKYIKEHENTYGNDTILIIKNWMKTDIEFNEKTAMINVYFENPKRQLSMSLFYWLLKYEPVALKDRLHVVVKAAIERGYPRTCNNFWKFCKNYAHLEIPQKIVECCLEKFKEDDTPEQPSSKVKQTCIEAFSHLMTPEQFSNFVSSYHPKSSKISTNTEENKTCYNIQKCIGINLKNVAPTSFTLQMVPIFNKGDYFKVIHRSLCFACRNVEENKVTQLVQELMKRTASNRKRAFRIAFTNLDKKSIFDFLNLFMQDEKVASVRKTILKSVFDFFSRNPDDYSWELVKLNMNAIDVNDEEAVNILTEVNKIPHDYVVRYTTFAWEILEKFTGEEEQKEERKALLLNSLTFKTIQELPPEFVDDLTKKYFFQTVKNKLTSFQLSFQVFVCKYIIYCTDRNEQTRRLQLAFSCLKRYIDATWNDFENHLSDRVYINHFVKRFCSHFLKDESPDRSILSQFYTNWSSLLQPHDAFTDYLHIQFTLIYSEKLKDPKDIGRKVALLSNSLVNVYGTEFLSSFYDETQTFLYKFFQGDDDVQEESRFLWVESFVNSESSTASLIIAILFFNRNIPSLPSTKLKYEEMMNILRERSNQVPCLKVYLHLHIKNYG